MRTQTVLPLSAALLILFATSSAAQVAAPSAAKPATPPTSRTLTPKACDMFDAQTATSILGAPVGNPTDVQGVSCFYVSGSGATVALVLASGEGAEGTNMLHAMQTVAAKQPGATTESIPGLGEQNFLFARASGQNSLVVLYHQKLITLSVQRQMTNDLKAAMVKAMRRVLRKL
jgi:hypothetical protein